jgi:glycoprotein endo-alpha-1,2-mannosidase
MIGLWLDRSHGEVLKHGGFDGFYSYFASQDISYGSDPTSWETMCRYAREVHLLSHSSR